MARWHLSSLVFLYFLVWGTPDVLAQNKKLTIMDYFKWLQSHNWQEIEKENAFLAKDLKRGYLWYKDVGSYPALTIKLFHYPTKRRPDMVLMLTEGCKGDVCVQVGFAVYQVSAEMPYNELTMEVTPYMELRNLIETYSYPFYEFPEKAGEPIKIYMHDLTPAYRTQKPKDTKKLLGELRYNTIKEIFELVKFPQQN